MIRVVLIEDDLDLIDDIAFSLRDEGFKVTTCPDGKAMDQEMANASFDVAVIDIGLPGEDGLSIARRLRAQRPQLGIVILTARTDGLTRIKGMEDGADVFLGKPTDVRELALVIHALVRRICVGKPFTTSALTLLVAENVLFTPQGRKIELTPNETLLLSRLARATGQRCTRREIIEALGGDYINYDERRLEATISRMRRKFDAAGLPLDLVQALRGVGYMLTERLEERLGRSQQVPDSHAA